ncbi:hypothetical protein LJC68_10340 [Bacteroidales bacterium OttesenSCG-928-B11]|nr:hypothetical protein [Bacteroidales bacterium OttesenSCG-928-C03]MDL2313260.1 hypothetical protein [Bacteroidales bacterium OttesenSCG-928-B11]
MKRLILLSILILSTISIFGQANGFKDFTEFSKDGPSLTFGFQLKQRTGGDVFMTGGIENFRLKKITPKSDIDKVEQEIWGVKVDDVVYINSYPYSKIKGYNQIIEKGFYSYFIGEPARFEVEQRKLGIIQETEKQIPVCCKVGYVILPDGTVKLLRPELLAELCKDNSELSDEIKNANLKLENVYEMFDFLKRYNAMKK